MTRVFEISLSNYRFIGAPGYSFVPPPCIITPQPYSVAHHLVRNILLNVFVNLCRLVGRYYSCLQPKQALGTHDGQHNKIWKTREYATLYISETFLQGRKTPDLMPVTNPKEKTKLDHGSIAIVVVVNWPLSSRERRTAANDNISSRSRDSS